MKNLYTALIGTANSIGIKIISDDLCCRLLAWLYVFGGSCEYVVKSGILNTEITEAQNRLNLHGGKMPNAELVPTFQAYARELEQCVKDKTTVPQWVLDLHDRYNLPKHYLGMNAPEEKKKEPKPEKPVIPDLFTI